MRIKSSNTFNELKTTKYINYESRGHLKTDIIDEN